MTTSEKDLSGGKLILLSLQQDSQFKAEDNIIVGNVALYGATSGKALYQWCCWRTICCVRNSGATCRR